MYKSSLLLFFVFVFPFISRAQLEKNSALVKGKVMNRATGQPAQDVQVTIPFLKLLTASDGTGEFNFSRVPYGTYSVVFSNLGIGLDTVRIVVAREVVDLGVIKVTPNDPMNIAQNAVIPTMVLDESSLSAEDDGISSQNVSGLLTASRDPFQNTAAFVFGPYRFQPRGYDRNMQQVFVNGIPMNDIETGDVYWSQWGGLNDVFRGRNQTYGLEPSDFAIGGINGAVVFDATAANQRKQTRITYSSSNRQYRNRLMLTHNSGLLSHGWSYSLSLSKRWSDEGYIPGTFYDGYSYYAGITKQIAGKHEFNLIAFGAPTKRGKAAPAIQEVYDITGNDFYNPNWGYQNGKKRNAKVAEYNQPTFILSYEFAPNESTRWNTSIGYQFGKNANSSFDWYNGADPRPDYYRYLPSWQIENFNNLAEAEFVKEKWQNDPHISQVNWDRIYEVNSGNFETVYNVNGIKGNNVYGRRSVYVIGSDVDELKKHSFNTYLQHAVNDHIKLYQGLTFLSQYTETYRRVDDLLGGDFFVNYNQFAETQYIGNTQAGQNDLKMPNRLVKKGDRYSYNYVSRFMKSWIWGQAVFTYNKVDFFAAISGGVNSFQRDGLYRNGLYPNNSFGKGSSQKFFTYTAKGGVMYKLNGRNYIFANGAITQDAPTIDNTYVSPRTRNQTVSNPTEQKILSAEGGYLLRSPKINSRLVGYATVVKDATEIKRFYNDDPAIKSFVNYALKDVSMRFTGLEVALDCKLNSLVNFTGVASLGQAFYINRPKVSIYQDNDTSATLISRTVYLKDYFLAVGPQAAYSFGLKYSSRHYWFGTLTFNYFDNNYIDIAADRRTEQAASSLEPNSATWHQVLGQEKLPSFFTVDLFIYKSILLSKPFKFLPGNTFLYLSLGVNNLLDNKEIKTGGFEQLRYDFLGNPGKFPSKYFNGYGRNYFANISFKF